MKHKVLFIPLLVSSLFILQGCYTQLAWFHSPDPSVQEDKGLIHSPYDPLFNSAQFRSGYFYNPYRSQYYDPLFWAYYPSPYSLYTPYPGSFYYSGGYPYRYWSYRGYGYEYGLTTGIKSPNKTPRDFQRRNKMKNKTRLVITRSNEPLGQSRGSDSGNWIKSNRSTTGSLSSTPKTGSASSKKSKSSKSSRRVTKRK